MQRLRAATRLLVVTCGEVEGQRKIGPCHPVGSLPWANQNTETDEAKGLASLSGS